MWFRVQLTAEKRRKILLRYKIPDSLYEDREEGYDGHLQWKNNSKVIEVMKKEFYDAVVAKNRDLVLQFLEVLGSEGNIGQIGHIVDLVLKRTSEPAKEALMCAICIGSRPLVEFILCLFIDFPYMERSSCTRSSAFSPHLTPLILASILNNFAIVECLLLRGHSILPPHHKNCACDNCHRMVHSALASMQKIDILRALSSEAYLWLGTDDPFAAACALSRDLSRFIADDNLEYAEWYQGLLQNVRRFAAKMIDQNWGEQELDLFLSFRDHSPIAFCIDPYPRVQMAMRAHMKDMIASTQVQRAMEEIWWRGWGSYGSSSKRDLYRLFRHFIAWPVLSLVYIFTNGRVAKSFDVPLGRFISNLSSYLIFIFCLFILRYMKLDGRNSSSFKYMRYVEGYIYAYTLGMIVEKHLQWARYGIKTYFEHWWRWFDCILILVFLLCMFEWSAQIMVYDHEDQYVADLKHYHSLDDHLLYDIFIGTGCILSIWKIFYYCQLKKGIGGSIISVGKCISTVYNYLIIMAVIMLSFAIGINMIVQPYNNRQGMDEEGNIYDIPRRFTTILLSLKSLYWTFYGYLDPSFYSNVVGNIGTKFEQVSHTMIAVSTEMLMAIYHIILIVTLLNLMISLLVKKAEKVLDNEISEFKYTRVSIYSDFIHWNSALPPPFNIVLLVKEIILRLISGRYSKQLNFLFVEKKMVFLDPEVHMEEIKSYRKLLINCFERYRSSKEYHYKSVFKTDFENKEKLINSVVKVAFMNEARDQIKSQTVPSFSRSQSRSTSQSGSRTTVRRQ